MSPEAVKDLPDPLDSSPTTHAMNPDDLLAQMADDAINKLMAEADADDLPPAKTVKPIAAAPGPIVAPPEPEPEPEPANNPLEDELEALLNPKTEPEPETAMPAAAEVAPAPEAEIDLPAASFADAPPATDAALAHAASAAAAHHEEPPAPAADMKALLAEPDQSPRSASFLLWPLRLLNAPFHMLSSPVRDALGQIGIVTMINAVGVLVYVLVFRRHH